MSDRLLYWDDDDASLADWVKAVVERDKQMRCKKTYQVDAKVPAENLCALVNCATLDRAIAWAAGFREEHPTATVGILVNGRVLLAY